jgi:glutamate-5-semialdehyde dehydrogenase
MDNIKVYMERVGQQARAASQIMAQAGTAVKNRALENIAGALLSGSKALIAANASDVAASH